jgi:hypothetical protein
MPRSSQSRKNLLIICVFAAGIVLASLLAVGVGTYLSVRQITRPLVYLSGAIRLVEQIANKAEYQLPVGGDLTPAQLALFLAAEREVESRLGERIAELRMKSEQLVSLSQMSKRHPPVRETLILLGTVGPAFLDGKKALVDALNRAGFSKDEFEWVREQAYHAAGVEAWQFDFSDVVRGVPDAEFDVHRLPYGVVASVSNRNLVAPHAEELKHWTALVFFGL